MNSKKLHKHALPIVLVAAALFVGTLGFTVASTSSHALDVADMLTTSAISINRTHNGLADVQLRSNSDSDASQDSVSHVAKAVAYQLALQSAQ